MYHKFDIFSFNFDLDILVHQGLKNEVLFMIGIFMIYNEHVGVCCSSIKEHYGDNCLLIVIY